MSIRLKFTLLYTAILAITLIVFGLALYSIQADSTMRALRSDIIRTSETLGESVLRSVTTTGGVDRPQLIPQPGSALPPPRPFNTFMNDQAFQQIPEREIVRILDAAGNLVASPYGRKEDALPLSTQALTALAEKRDWWESGDVQEYQMLIYSRPIIKDGTIQYILQVARPLTERQHSLQSLQNTLVLASLITLLAAFGIGWLFLGVTLQPIQRITKTARTIGEDRDFTKRVQHSGPQDEVGQLATTFNSMLSRLQDAYQQVGHALAQQRDFVADVSHELRTPLTTLRGNLGLLMRIPRLPVDEQTDILNDMVIESDRMIRLVNELLRLAHADAGRNLNMEVVPIRPIIEETCRQVQALDKNRDITFVIPEEISMVGDHDALKQVFLILLDNAIKHSSGQIQVAAVKLDGSIKIEVKDQGVGISPESLVHVFDRFYKAEEEEDSSGFGLGLPIAKSLIEGQKGKIQIDSVLGQGSTVTLLFPVPTAGS